MPRPAMPRPAMPRSATPRSATPRSAVAPPAPFRARAAWLLPLLLVPGFLAVGVRATPFEHSPLALLVMGVLYGLLALFLFLGARFARHAGRAWGGLACLALGLVPAAQLRMDAEELQSLPVLAGFVFVVAALAYGLVSLGAPRAPAASVRRLGEAAGALSLLAAATFGAAHASDELRWHLFKHHRLFGPPLYALAARPLLVERDSLWDSRGRLAHPGEYVHETPPAPVVFEKPPHVVFLMLDTLRADALASLGGGANVMPAMNSLAENSVLFTDVHANASWTRASCASIFTGLLPEEHGAARFHEALSEDWITLPEQLRAAGYQTAAFVANWVQVGKETGFAQGFDAPDFHELMSGLMSSAEILERTGGNAGTEVRESYARAETLNRSALDWLAGDVRDPYKPLFLYLHYLDPHTPYLEPPEPGTLSDARERKRGLYRQQLRYLDRQLAQFLAQLDEVLAGPKMIVFTSDHGEEFWEHDEWGHGHALYKEVLWVPLFVRLPDGRTGRVEAPLESRDLYALVLDLVRDPRLDLEQWGASHAREVRYASQYLDRAEDARPDKKWTGLRRVDGRGASLIWSAYGATYELYDEARDPLELANRIERDGERELFLRAALERSVRFWTAPIRVERTAEELEFLRALGYAGGVEAEGGRPEEP
jgi:arylsulfatase A-like enzyme